MGVCFPLAGAGDQVALRGANGHCQCAYEAGPFTDSAGEDDRLGVDAVIAASICAIRRYECPRVGASSTIWKRPTQFVRKRPSAAWARRGG